MRTLVSLFACCALLAPVAGAAPAPSWADPQIRVVTARGLMGGDAHAFAPDRELTADELDELVTGLGGKAAPVTTDPAAVVTIAKLDATLVKGLGLGAAARRFQTSAAAAGLAPPARFGTEVVARLLGFRTDHRQDTMERRPSDPATRAEAAYSAAKVLGWKGWEAQYARDLAVGFAPDAVSGWQETVLREAVSLTGYPYVWGGTSERPQKILGKQAPGGFDCSGLIWRVFLLADYAEGTELATAIRGRTTYDMSREVPRAQRILFDRLEPADLVFFGPRGPRSKASEIDHAGIYLGGSWMIHSSSQGVSLAPLTGTYETRFAWGRRPLAEAGLS